VVFVEVGLGSMLPDVTEPLSPLEYLSRHPQSHPGVEQWCDVVGEVDKLLVVVESRQPPNQP
jgi:hypothetical protein